MIDENVDEISFIFNRDLTDSEFKQFFESMRKYNVPLDSADMYDGNSGIDIHLDEKISGFEFKKAKENMNNILKEIATDLEIVDENAC